VGNQQNDVGQTRPQKSPGENQGDLGGKNGQSGQTVAGDQQDKKERSDGQSTQNETRTGEQNLREKGQGDQSRQGKNSDGKTEVEQDQSR